MQLRAFLENYSPFLLPSALGFLVIYWLLPRVRQSKQAWAAAAGGLALVGGGILLLHGTGIWPETLLFLSFATIAVVGGVMLVTQHNPVYAALSFALVVLSTCGLFLLNGAPFLTAATIVVYAGAIVVTFLFVIMLAQQSGAGNADVRSREPFFASVAGFVLLASLLGVLHRTFDQHELNELTADLERLSKVQDAKDIDAVLGPMEPRQMTPRLAEKLKKYLPDTDDAEKNYAGHIVTLRIEGNTNGLRDEAKRALAALDVIKAGYGTVASGSANGKLPRENVAGLGYALFTDYLVPVELAAVLLLVATIGAIAIATRRGGELR
jgi:NADH:ubiquinone oxidoreductase subunit 6 (subunit J)